MRSLFLLVLGIRLGAMALGCQAPSAPSIALARETSRAVTAGTSDDGDPAVVAIVFADDPTALRCTGTVISERVVLTAAHCGAQYDPGAFEVFFGSDVAGSGSRLTLLQAVAHPEYDDTESHDLALLLLAEPAPAPAAPLAAEPLVAASSPVSLRLVGYGDTSGSAGDGGQKRQGVTQTTAVYDQYVELGPDPSLPCIGDSGGPAYISDGADELVAAVVSRGDATCLSYSKATRVDAHLDSFILPYLAATDPGVVVVGEDCLYAEHCASGLCVEAVDEPLLHYCSQVCDDDVDCPDPLVCDLDECRYPLPSPGAVGAPCTEQFDCLRGECLDDGVCNLRCVAGRGDCPEGYQCAHLGGIDFFCQPEPSRRKQGCSTAGATTPGSALPLLIGLLLALVVLLNHRRQK